MKTLTEDLKPGYEKINGAVLSKDGEIKFFPGVLGYNKYSTGKYGWKARIEALDRVFELTETGQGFIWKATGGAWCNVAENCPLKKLYVEKINSIRKIQEESNEEERRFWQQHNL